MPVLLNAIGLLCISAVLIGASVFQVVLGELPCPLCLLQRVAFVGVSFGLLLNIRYGQQPRHIAIVVLAALFGMAVSGRQVLLHIAPGTGGYGSDVFGLHFYTWAFVLFGLTVVGAAVLLMLGPQVLGPEDARPPVMAVAAVAGWSAIALAVLNAVTTFIECGPIECPPNPVQYWLFH